MRSLAVAALASVALAAHGALAAQPTWKLTDLMQAQIPAISFVDQKTGFIAGGSNFPPAGPNVLKTVDGGLNWTPLPIQPAMIFTSLAAASVESAVVTGVGFLVTQQYMVDGNAFTNSSVNAPVIVEQSMDVQPVQGVAGSFAICTALQQLNNSLPAGLINTLLLSKDGGATFDLSLIPGNASMYQARYGSYPSANVAFVAAGSFPYNNNPSPEPNPGPDADVPAPQFATMSAGARRRNTRFMHRERRPAHPDHDEEHDKGRKPHHKPDGPHDGPEDRMHHRRHHHGDKKHHKKGHFLFPHLYMGADHMKWVQPNTRKVGDNGDGYNGAIYRSTDGYQTWTTLFTNDTMFFNQIACPSEQVCYALANDATPNSYLYVTRDGGDSWTVQFQVPSSALTAVVALSENEIFLAGGNANVFEGLFYYSKDGGVTFDKQTVAGYALIGLSCVDTEHCWATSIDNMDQMHVMIWSA